MSLRPYVSLLLAVVSCTRPVEPLPGTAVQFDPPAHYALWWKMTEQCSGRRGSYDAVRWYTVPGKYVGIQNGDTLIGAWYPGRNQIVLSQLGLRDPLLIRHEMLHALVNKTGHSREDFYARCNGYVSCVDACAREAGPIDSLPQPNAVPLDLEQLVVKTWVTPSVVSDSTYDGWFAIVVSVTNPLDRSARVQLSIIPGNPPGSNDPSQTLGWQFVGGRLGPFSAGNSGYGYIWGDSIGFDAGETRTLVIDNEAQSLFLQPGTYTVHGWFNVDTAAATSFTFK